MYMYNKTLNFLFKCINNHLQSKNVEFFFWDVTNILNILRV